MENNTDDRTVKQKTFPATVAKVINDFRLVINKGSIDDIRQDQRMLVYALSNEEIKDPNTGESLGFLEKYKGTGKVIQVLEKMSIIESDRKKNVFERVESGMPALKSPLDTFPKYKYLKPFENPQIGDLVKPI